MKIWFVIEGDVEREVLDEVEEIIATRHPGMKIIQKGREWDYP